MFGNLSSNEDGIGKPLLIMLIIVGVIALFGIGYTVGTNNAESDIQRKIDEKTEQLQTEINEIRQTADEGIDDVQEDIGEGQETIESLQTENAQLKATIQEQEQKIAELEAQLEEPDSNTTQ